MERWTPRIGSYSGIPIVRFNLDKEGEWVSFEDIKPTPSAWEMRRELEKKYGQKFISWVHFKRLEHGASIASTGAHWIISKPEPEAIAIMQEFLKEAGESISGPKGASGETLGEDD